MLDILSIFSISNIELPICRMSIVNISYRIFDISNIELSIIISNVLPSVPWHPPVFLIMMLNESLNFHVPYQLSKSYEDRLFCLFIQHYSSSINRIVVADAIVVTYFWPSYLRTLSSLRLSRLGRTPFKGPFKGPFTRDSDQKNDNFGVVNRI